MGGVSVVRVKAMRSGGLETLHVRNCTEPIRLFIIKPIRQIRIGGVASKNCDWLAH